MNETWHETLESLSLRRIIPHGFSFIDAPRPIRDGDDDKNSFSNRGALDLLHRDNIRVVMRNLKTKVSTFEYLCGYTTIDNRHILLHGTYRCGSYVATSELFEQLTSPRRTVYAPLSHYTSWGFQHSRRCSY